MGERESRGSNLKTIISNLESTNILADTNTAQSLKELYQSGAYRSAVSDAPGEQGWIKALRIVRRGEGIGELLSIVLYAKGLEEKKSPVLNTIREETKKLLKTSRRMTPELESLALKLLKERQLNTVAAMVIIEGFTSGRHIFEVRYPEVFMNLDPSIPPSQRDTVGLTLAMYFLRRAPLK